MNELDIILNKIEEKLGVDISASSIMVDYRGAEFSDARMVYYKLSRELTVRSTKEIGDKIKRNHSTVIIQANKAGELIEVDPHFNKKYEMILSGCKSQIKAYYNEITESEAVLQKQAYEMRLAYHKGRVKQYAKLIKQIKSA